METCAKIPFQKLKIEFKVRHNTNKIAFCVIKYPKNAQLNETIRKFAIKIIASASLWKMSLRSATYRKLSFH